jgi:hypothetical protein
MLAKTLFLRSGILQKILRLPILRGIGHLVSQSVVMD